MNKLKAIIAAGGKGTRLRPLTFSANKHLLPIANQPLLLYPFLSIVELGIKEIGIVVNESRPAVEALLGDGSKWGVKITYINQARPAGVADVVRVSEKFLRTSPFVYILGDNIFTEGIKNPYNYFLKKKPAALLSVVKHEENYRLGVPFFKNGKIVKVVEKPKNPPNKFGIPGLYFFTHHVFKAFRGPDKIKPSARGELEITDLFNYLINHGYKVEASEIKGQWLDPGKFDDSIKANQLLLKLNCQRKIKGKKDKNTKIIGRVSVGKGTIIKNSQIFGPTSIGEEVFIKNSFIGPYTSIEGGGRIVSSKIENSILMRGARVINWPKLITESMIGKGALISSQKSKKQSYKITIADLSKLELS